MRSLMNLYTKFQSSPILYIIVLTAFVGSGMSVWGVVKTTVPKNVCRQTRSLLNNTTCNRFQSRTFSICRQHEAEIRARKSRLRTHIRALEQSRRRFSTSLQSYHGHIDPPKPGEELHVTFIDKDGDGHTFEVAQGDNLLDIAQANDLEMEGTYRKSSQSFTDRSARCLWWILCLLNLPCDCKRRRHL